MQTSYDCLPCFIRQAIDASRVFSADPPLRERIIREVLGWAADMDFSQPPAIIGGRIHRRLREITGEDDPYRKTKELQNRMALRLLPRLKEEVANADDPLWTAARLAIAGNVIDLGVNGKMSEVCGAMGLTSLEAMEDIVAVNRRNYLTYCEELASVPGVSVIRYEPEEKNNYQYVVIEVDPDVCPRNRDEIVDALHAENVIARKYFWPGCHRMEPYRTTQPETWKRLPKTERVAARVIVLPTGQTVDEATVRRVCGIIRGAVGTT